MPRDTHRKKVKFQNGETPAKWKIPVNNNPSEMDNELTEINNIPNKKGKRTHYDDSQQKGSEKLGPGMFYLGAKGNTLKSSNNSKNYKIVSQKELDYHDINTYDAETFILCKLEPISRRNQKEPEQKKIVYLTKSEAEHLRNLKKLGKNQLMETYLKSTQSFLFGEAYPSQGESLSMNKHNLEVLRKKKLTELYEKKTRINETLVQEEDLIIEDQRNFVASNNQPLVKALNDPKYDQQKNMRLREAWNTLSIFCKEQSMSNSNLAKEAEEKKDPSFNSSYN